MKKLVLIGLGLATALSLAGCNEDHDLAGTLTVNSQLALKGKKSKDIVLQPGVYPVRFASKKGEARLVYTEADKKQVATFKLPKDFSLRSLNELDYTAAQSGQPYDIKGSEKTQSSVTPEMNGRESCTFVTSERICGYEREPVRCRNVDVQPNAHANGPANVDTSSTSVEPKDTTTGATVIINPAEDSDLGAGRRRPGSENRLDARLDRGRDHRHGGGGTGGQICYGGETVYRCYDRTVTHYGTQEVTYFDTTSTTYSSILLLEPVSKAEIATFAAVNDHTDRTYTFKGQCY